METPSLEPDQKVHSMNTELNKQVARRFYERFDANDIAGVLDTMAEDSRFWIAGKPGSNGSIGWHTKPEMARMFKAMTAQMPRGLRMTVDALIAEGDKVALEVHSHGELSNGRVYENEYHALITVRDGKIAEVKEYMDTQHVHQVWFV
jgi:ketosteroid isomerase-like protein